MYVLTLSYSTDYNAAVLNASPTQPSLSHTNKKTASFLLPVEYKNIQYTGWRTMLVLLLLPKAYYYNG